MAVKVPTALELDNRDGSGGQGIGGAAQLSELGDHELGCRGAVCCVRGVHARLSSRRVRGLPSGCR